MTTAPTNPKRMSDRFLGSTAVLLVVVLGLLFLRTPQPVVEAGVVVSADAFTMMTAAARDAGQNSGNEDVLYIMDNHHGILLIYQARSVANNDRIELIDGGFVSDLFATVRK